MNHQLWAPLLNSLRTHEEKALVLNALSQWQIYLLSSFLSRTWTNISWHPTGPQWQSKWKILPKYKNEFSGVLYGSMDEELLTKAYMIQRRLCHCKTHSRMGDDSQKLQPWSSLQAGWMMGDSPLPSSLQWIQSCEFQKLPETSKLLTSWVLMSLPPGHKVKNATQ